MGRRPIRGLDGRLLSRAYSLLPEEQLFPDGFKSNLQLAKTRFGKGSGRAGGARSSTHKVDHTKWVGKGVPVGSCPACRYGVRVWKLWLETQGWRQEWITYWEGRDDERKACEEFIAAYEALTDLQDR